MLSANVSGTLLRLRKKYPFGEGGGALSSAVMSDLQGETYNYGGCGASDGFGASDQKHGQGV